MRKGANRAKRIAICHLKALILTAPARLREQLERQPTDERLSQYARLRTLQHDSNEHRATLKALRSIARHALALTHEADDLELLVARVAPQLLNEPGVGTLTAAEILITWSPPGRTRNDGAFAIMCGAAPIPTSSGQVI